MDIRNEIKSAIRKLIELTGYELNPINSRGLAYISAAKTKQQAREKNMTIPQYLESIWGLETASKKVMTSVELDSHLHNGPFSILEIGAGTGIYTNETIKIIGEKSIAKYQVYETNKEWSDYLKETYRVERATADGYKLGSTNDHSVDLIHAHGVFVYTSFITTMSYINEICRTAKVNCIVAFDAFDESCFTPEIIDKLIRSKQTYFSIVPEQMIRESFQENGFELIKTFYTNWGTGQPKYFVFKRNKI